jgi:DNA-binding XRE family transcriptional regulator|tara:strand:+ start:5711 stop:6100 length:390 start_codon:yes stop_codon:yes gene_type:complete
MEQENELKKIRIMKTDTVTERIEYVRSSSGVTKAGFAKSIGITPQGFQAMLNGSYVMSVTAVAIEYVYGIRREWLAEGEGKIRTDQWERIRGEVEESLLRDMRLFMENRLKQVKPLLSGKDKDGSYTKR